jgi:hypothetical protein
MLERAEALGRSHPWLDSNFGDALWQASVLENRPERADEALRRYERAYRTSSSPPARRNAAESIADIRAERLDLDIADEYYRAAMNVPGDNCVDCIAHKYSVFLLYSRQDYEAGLRYARIAARPPSFPLARDVLLRALALRGSELALMDREAEARPLFAEARAISPTLEELAPTFAVLPSTYIGVRGLRAMGFLPDLSGPTGGKVLVEASGYLDRSRLEELLAWGANPRFVEPTGTTALHKAILANNVEAVRLLLERGANPSARFEDGRTPLEMASYPQDDAGRAQIRALLEQAAPAVQEQKSHGLPLTIGAVYTVKQNVSGDRWGHELLPGELVIFDGPCRFGYADRTLACLMIKRPDEARAFDVAIAEAALASWADWFEIVREP